MSTDEIAKTIQVLKVNTIQDALKQSGSKAFQNASAKSTKPELIKLYEQRVMDVGVEKFIARININTTKQIATLLGLDIKADSAQDEKTYEKLVKAEVAEKVQETGIQAFLSKASFELLTNFVTEMGLTPTTDKKDAEQSIADEAMLTGMEGFLNLLSQITLKKHCTELSLNSTGEKKAMVERLMVHIFELEPLNPEGAETGKEEEKEKEDKPKEKESKKRKDSDKSDTPSKKSKKAKDETPTKRATRAKKEGSDESDSEEETPKKEKKTPKKDKSPGKGKKAEEDTPGKRAWVAPPLSTIKKGAYNYQQFYDLFNLTDLQQYCKNEGLKGKGVKKEVIRDIMRYLETGEKEDETKKKKKVKKGKSPKKADSKEDKDEKDSKEEKETEKEKKEEKKAKDEK